MTCSKFFAPILFAAALACAPCNQENVIAGQRVATSASVAIATAPTITQQVLVQQPQTVTVPVTVQRQSVEMVEVEKTVKVLEPRVTITEETVNQTYTLAPANLDGDICVDCQPCNCVNCECSTSAAIGTSHVLAQPGYAPVDTGVSVQKARAVNRTRPGILGRLRARRVLVTPPLGDSAYNNSAYNIRSARGNSIYDVNAQAAANRMARTGIYWHTIERQYRDQLAQMGYPVRFAGTGINNTCWPEPEDQARARRQLGRNLILVTTASAPGRNGNYMVRWWI